MINKVFKFLFPIPSIIITILAFILFYSDVFDEGSGKISDVFGMTILFYIMFVLPLNLIIFIFKEAKRSFRIFLVKLKEKYGHKEKTYNFSQTKNNQTRDDHNNMQLNDSLKAQKIHKLEEIKSTNINFKDLVLNNPSILQNIEKNIFEFYSELGIHVLVSRTDIHASQIIVRITPHDGIRIKTILSFKDDLSLRLGVPVEMEVFSKLGFIGIMIPISYVEKLIGKSNDNTELNEMFFKSKEEKEIIKKDKLDKKASSVEFTGKCIQNVGSIPSGSFCVLKINPNERTLNISHNKFTAEIPLDRVLGFSLDDEVTLKSGNTSIGGAIIGGALFGGAGAIIGANSKKGNTEKRWIGTLLFENINGQKEELNFIASTIIGDCKGNSPLIGHLNFKTTLHGMLLQNTQEKFTL